MGDRQVRAGILAAAHGAAPYGGVRWARSGQEIDFGGWCGQSVDYRSAGRRDIGRDATTISDASHRNFPTAACERSREDACMNMRRPKSGQRALRRGRVSLPDHHYLVTTVCDKRRRCFESARVAACVSGLLQEQRTWRNSTPICWVLMPDHLHLLLRLAGDESLSHLVNRLKSITARAATEAACGFGPVWMRGFHDRAMRDEAECEIAARYVLENPVRAGLVARVEDYPYRACVWELGGPGW